MIGIIDHAWMPYSTSVVNYEAETWAELWLKETMLGDIRIICGLLLAKPNKNMFSRLAVSHGR